MNTAPPTPAPRRLIARAHAWAVVVAASALVVTACTGPPAPADTLGESGAGSPAPSADRGSAPATDAVQGGSAGAATDEGQSQEDPGQITPKAPVEDGARAVDTVDSALRNLIATQGSVTREQVRAAIEQGFASAEVTLDSIEVSVDSTPTGLDVDAIQGAGRTGDTCVFGEIRESEVSVSVLPVLGSGHCFVGGQR